MDLQGTADLPFSDTVRSSLSFSSAKRDGYQRRIPFPGSIPSGAGAEDASQFPVSGLGSDDREGSVDQWSARAKLVFEPNDVFKLTLAGDYQNVDQSASPNTVMAIDTFAPGGFPFYNLCLLDHFDGADTGECRGPRGGFASTPVPYKQLPGSRSTRCESCALRQPLRNRRSGHDLRHRQQLFEAEELGRRRDDGAAARRQTWS